MSAHTERVAVLGVRPGEVKSIAGPLVDFDFQCLGLHFLVDGEYVTVVSPDGRSLAHFEGLFGPSATPGQFGADVAERWIGQWVELEATGANVISLSTGGLRFWGRYRGVPVPWRSVDSVELRPGASVGGQFVRAYRVSPVQRDPRVDVQEMLICAPGCGTDTVLLRSVAGAPDLEAQGFMVGSRVRIAMSDEGTVSVEALRGGSEGLRGVRRLACLEPWEHAYAARPAIEPQNGVSIPRRAAFGRSRGAAAPEREER